MIKANRTSVLHALNRFLSLNSVRLVALCAHGTEVVVVILGLSLAFEYTTEFPTSKAFVSPARTSLDVHHQIPSAGRTKRMSTISAELSPTGLRSNLENRGEVRGIIIEFDEDEVEHWSLENCPGFETEGRRLGIQGGGKYHLSTILI